jgi:zinc D-Ala-D-Ala carboxypeptidase
MRRKTLATLLLAGAAMAGSAVLATPASAAAAEPATALAAEPTSAEVLALEICPGAIWGAVSTVPRRYIFAPALNGQFSCILRQGVFNNWGVVALQNALVRCYGANIAIDGDFGPATKAALVAAQRREGIPADGVYGPLTNSVLNWPAYLAAGNISAPYICVDPA